MKSLQTYITEKLKITKSTKNNVSSSSKIKVTNFAELSKVIEEKYNKDQVHCDMTDVDVSEMEVLSAAFKSYPFETIDITGWNTSKVKDFGSMFSNCAMLKRIIGIEDIDVSNAESISRMFSYNDKIEELDLSNWDVSNVREATWMFAVCKNLKSVDVSDWDLSNAATIEGMFCACPELEHVDISGWRTSSKLHVIERLFGRCPKIESIDMKHLDLSGIKSIYQLCQHCDSLTSVKLPDSLPSMLTMTSAFQGCEKLETISGIENWDVSNVKYGDYAFDLCKSLTADLRNWDISRIASKTRMFYGVSKNLKKPKVIKK